MLKLNNIEVIYSNVILVLRGVSLEVAPGAIVALLGANGAGKSTTLKSISGLLRVELGEVTDGSIEFEGERIDKKNPEEIVKRGIIQVMEGRRLFDHLTVEENLRASGYVIGDGARIKRDLDLVYSYFPRLKDLNHRISGYLSGGEQQKMFIARAMAQEAEIVLLDEPLAGLDVPATADVVSLFRKLERATLVVALHDLAIAAGSFDLVLLLHERAIHFGAPAETFQEEYLRQAYGGCVRLVRTEEGQLVVHDDACAREDRP